MSNAPHWGELLSDLWELAGEETFESVDIREYCEKNGYSEIDVANVLDVYPMWDYIEWGVSPMYPWFHEEFTTTYHK